MIVEIILFENNVKIMISTVNIEQKTQQVSKIQLQLKILIKKHILTTSNRARNTKS